MKKGFTLIELLAVIIILAVIALIATPIVLNVVDNAKESARKSSVAGYADAVKLARTEAQFNNLPFNDNDLSDLSIETNTNNVNCNEVKFDTMVGVILTGCYVDDYTAHAYNYSGGVVTPDIPDTNAPIVTAKADLSGVTDNISSYFNIDKNGHGIITSIVCTEGENTVTSVSQLGYGGHTITCTVTKANHMSDSASATINSTEEITTAILNKFPQLALGNTADKGCATPGENNYTYMGGCYLTGTQTSNYIWFNGLLYRIMGINKDESVRLITQENLTSMSWGANNTANNYNASYVKDWLNDYFLTITNTNSTLNNYIVNQTFCSEDYNTQGTTRTTCTNNLDSNPIKKAGLISIDEYNLAGGANSYLNIDEYVWTLSPSSAAKEHIISEDGASTATDIISPMGIRAVINIASNTLITAGNGNLTNNNYYVLGENKGDSNTTGTLLANAKIGEYVYFSNKTYRVISNNADGTKIILDGYYDYNSDSVIDSNDYIAYGRKGSTIPICTICNYKFSILRLNPDDSNKLQSTTWYQGLAYSYGANYKTTSLETSGSAVYTNSYGLIKLGEILSGYSSTMQEKIDFWLVTPINDNQYAMSFRWYGAAGYADVTTKKAIRPVLNINSSTTIISGNGTPEHPYNI